MRYRDLAITLRFLVWLNIIDSLLTVSVVGLNWATEANPIMDYFLQAGPLTFGVCKMSLAIIGAVLLWYARHSKKINVNIVAGALAMIYLGIVTYEAVMISAMVMK